VVVIASAGLLLLLEAEFMAFALIIVYAGAILITYMFVLILRTKLTIQMNFQLKPRLINSLVNPPLLLQLDF
jgi:NADH:ubiquinone oxidoreductase subunit 6 (subunit J)